MFDSVIEGDACALVTDQQEQLLENELAGKSPISREIVVEEGQLIGGPDGATAIGTRSGETLLRKQLIALTIEPDGKLSDCLPVSLDPLPVFNEALWCRRFLASADSNPLPPSQVDRSARPSVYYKAVYLRSAAQ